MKKAIALVAIVTVFALGRIILKDWYYDKERIHNKQIEIWNHRIGLFSKYKEYVPQVFDGDKTIEIPSMLTKKHQENVIKVLKYHGNTWKIEKGKLLVPEELDNEILWNYTTKANDSIWLQEHK